MDVLEILFYIDKLFIWSVFNEEKSLSILLSQFKYLQNKCR